MEHVILVRYSEIHLKGLNRPFFERKLADGVRRAIAPFGGQANKIEGRLLVSGYPEEQHEQVLTALTRVFGVGRSQSQEARLLTNAVNLAQNAAEAVSASTSPDDVAALLTADGAEQAGILVDGTQGVTARYNQQLQPDPEGSLRLEISWEPEEMMAGTLVNSTITVLHGQETEPVYSIDTAVYLNEVKE